jgi:CDP-diacylglycerol--serine O-phosphatidyltransferase
VASFIAPEFIPTSPAPTPVVAGALNRLARLPRLPDLLTTANLGCGVGSILLASQGQLTIACGLIFLAAVFDVFDGLAARALGGGSPLGAQLDSLADMVSFGVAPGVISVIAMATYRGWNLSTHLETTEDLILQSSSLLIISIASMWRLAKFNLDTRQTHGFLGLPTPANALFWASVGLMATPYWRFESGLAKIYGLLFAGTPNLQVVALLLSILMLSELPLPSLKFKHKGWKGNEVIFLLIGIGAVLALLYGILAVPLILIIYLLSPLWGKLFPKAH